MKMTNSKSTKRALLTSALAILMCLAMLIGTTFAWFTDTASTSVNTIQAGTLDVSLEKWDGEKWVNAEGETLNFVAADGRADILWEPGCTYELPTLRVVNNGNLALRYKVIISGIKGDAKLNEVIEWKRCAMFANGTYSYPSDIEGNVLMSSVIYPGAETELPDYMPAAGTFKISGHMKETAGNEYQGLSIDGIAITVVATQAQYESDSKDNTYDKDAPLPEEITAAELREMFVDENGKIKNVTLDKDYVLTTPWTPIDSWHNETFYDAVIDGNGHTIYNMYINSGSKAAFIGNFASAGKLTIKDLTFANATVITSGSFAGVVLGYQYGDVTLENVDVINSSVATTAEKGIRLGGLVGYSNLQDGAKLSLKDCDVANSSFKGYHNTCGLVGTLYNYTTQTANYSVENCTVSGCDFTWGSTNEHHNNFAFVDGAGYAATYDQIPAGVTVTDCTKH